jgi:hypothetical protein
MKLLLVLSLCVTLILGPAMAIPGKPSARAEADMEEQCRVGGGCFVVTEKGFEQAMLMAFQKGYETGGQHGYQFGLKACTKGSI